MSERKLQARDETEIYPNDQGHIVIHQVSQYGPDEDLYVFLHKDDFPQILKWLQEVYEEMVACDG